jgi:hypothetical protein
MTVENHKGTNIKTDIKERNVRRLPILLEGGAILPKQLWTKINVRY